MIDNYGQITNAIVNIITGICGSDKITSSIVFESNCLSNFTFMDIVNRVVYESSRTQKVSLQIELENFPRVADEYRKCSVIMINSIESFVKEFLRSRSISMRHESPIVIVLMEYHDTNEIIEIFNILWHANLYNVNVLQNDMTVLTFFPFRKNYCNNVKPVTINRFSNGNFTNSTSNFFPDKLKNLKGCPINIAAASNAQPYLFADKLENGSYNLYGRDITLLNTLADALNFKTQFTYVGEDVLAEMKECEGFLEGIIVD